VLISLSHAIEPVGGYTTETATHGQCDVSDTFPATEYHRLMANDYAQSLSIYSRISGKFRELYDLATLNNLLLTPNCHPFCACHREDFYQI